LTARSHEAFHDERRWPVPSNAMLRTLGSPHVA
jgi:hypothetical protein